MAGLNLEEARAEAKVDKDAVAALEAANAQLKTDLADKESELAAAASSCEAGKGELETQLTAVKKEASDCTASLITADDSV